MRACWRGFRKGRAMIEPLIGLSAALLVAAYLLVTLLQPERF
ncbi:potassium-transporting ATPase subunit F [Methylocella sp.]